MGKDIYTEPEAVDQEALRNLGPLSFLAGSWEGLGVDTHPVAEGTEDEPLDPQAIRPQLLYGLRYHVHVNKLDERPTFHDQVGYWLWEPSTGELMQSVALPRGLVAPARGRAEPKAKSFTVRAVLDAPTSGIVSAPFLAMASTHPSQFWSSPPRWAARRAALFAGARAQKAPSTRGSALSA